MTAALAFRSVAAAPAYAIRRSDYDQQRMICNRWSNGRTGRHELLKTKLFQGWCMCSSLSSLGLRLAHVCQ